MLSQPREWDQRQHLSPVLPIIQNIFEQCRSKVIWVVPIMSPCENAVHYTAHVLTTKYNLACHCPGLQQLYPYSVDYAYKIDDGIEQWDNDRRTRGFSDIAMTPLSNNSVKHISVVWVVRDI
jgi:hypothetical protein